MVYLLFGTKDYSINNEIKKICKNIDDMNISRYDLNNDLTSLVIEDAKTISLFGDKKIVIADNANMFTASTSKDSEIIEDYLKNINEYTDLIFIVHSDKIDARKKITKAIKEKGKIIEFNDDLDAVSLIRRLFKDYNIEYSDIKLLIDRVGNNPLIITNEINKIKIYKGNDKNITSEDILNLTNKIIEIDVFKLIDYIVRKDKENALELYNEMLKVNEEPIKIIVILANQFRIMYQSKELLKKGYSEKDIASILKIHPYRVKLAIQNSRNYTSEMLLKYLNDLADIDIGIKTGTINKDLALELFILFKFR